MTWIDLISSILESVPHDQLNEPAIFVEPYDKDKAAYEIAPVLATEDITVEGKDEKQEVVVREGKWMLR